MMRKIKRCMVLAVGLFSLAACLDQYPEDAILEKDAMKTVSDVDQAVIGIYAGFKSASLYSGALTLLPDIQSDLVYGVNGYTNTYGDIWRWEILSTNEQIASVYGALYHIIGRCNYVLDKMETVRQNTRDDKELEKLEVCQGEIYFARALAYSELLKMFCKAYEDDATAEHEWGVVLASSYAHPGRQIRSSLKASYEFVLEDLRKAEEGLALDKDDASVIYDTPYFTAGAVNALYARVYLYMNKFDEAIAYASKVIDSKKYSLAYANKHSYSNAYNDFQYMWQYDDATEIIWKISFDISSYGGALGTVFLNYDYTSYRPDYVPAQWALDLYASDDLRYEAYFGTVTTGFSHGLTWPLLIKYFGNLNFRNSHILFVSMPKPFRLAEQYLIRAEAYCRCDRHLYALAGKDISALRAARYKTYGSSTAISETTWQKVIEEERVKELFMEGFRLMDLKRWHKGFKRTPQACTISSGNSLNIGQDHALFVWPIPQHELEAPGSEIQPNESNR